MNYESIFKKFARSAAGGGHWPCRGYIRTGPGEWRPVWGAAHDDFRCGVRVRGRGVRFPFKAREVVLVRVGICKVKSDIWERMDLEPQVRPLIRWCN